MSAATITNAMSAVEQASISLYHMLSSLRTRDRVEKHFFKGLTILQTQIVERCTQYDLAGVYDRHFFGRPFDMRDLMR